MSSCPGICVMIGVVGCLLERGGCFCLRDMGRGFVFVVDLFFVVVAVVVAVAVVEPAFPFPTDA